MTISHDEYIAYLTRRARLPRQSPQERTGRTQTAEAGRNPSRGGKRVGVRPSKKDALVRRFLLHWFAAGGPALDPEYQFHPERRWRFDFAYVCGSDKVAIEIDGGIWTGGRHTRGMGFANDCDKLNAAAALGWRVFRLTEVQLRDGRAVTEIVQAINGGEAAKEKR